MTTTKLIDKTIKLSLQFDKYLSKKPELYDKIPNKSTVFFTVKGDAVYNRYSRNSVKKASTYGKFVEARKEGRTWNIHRYQPSR